MHFENGEIEIYITITAGKCVETPEIMMYNRLRGK